MTYSGPTHVCPLALAPPFVPGARRYEMAGQVCGTCGRQRAPDWWDSPHPLAMLRVRKPLGGWKLTRTEDEVYIGTAGSIFAYDVRDY